jgi:hypothetical protein
MGSTSQRQHDKHSRRYASSGSENGLLVPHKREGKRRTARNSAQVSASASAEISQEASSMDKTAYAFSKEGVEPNLAYLKTRREQMERYAKHK